MKSFTYILFSTLLLLSSVSAAPAPAPIPAKAVKAAAAASTALPSAVKNPKNFEGLSDLELANSNCQDQLSLDAQNASVPSAAFQARCDQLQAAINKIPGALGNVNNPTPPGTCLDFLCDKVST